MSDKLWKALRAGNANALAKTLATADLAIRDKSGYTPLAYAAMNGDAASVAALCEAGADVNAPMDYGVRALTLSVRHPEICASLCERADVNAASDAGVTALHRAVFWDAAPSVRALLERGAMMTRTAAGRTPLGIAAERASETIVELLLDRGADPNEKDSAPLSALFTRRPFVVLRNVSHACEVAPLALACRPQRAAVRRLLVERGAAIDATFAPHISPLMVAAAHGDLDAVADLLASGADPSRIAGDGPNRGSWEGTSALWYALEHHHFELAARLLDAGARARAPTMRSALRAAAHAGSRELAARLIEAGCDVNAGDSEDYSAAPLPLQAAAAAGHADVVELLLDAGADPALGREKYTPLDLARREKHNACIALLVEARSAEIGDTP